MPRTKPLPKREREICARLVDFRRSKGITRAGVARALGINQFSLANIERAAAPLRSIAGYNFCLMFNRSLQWLATGQLPCSTFTPASTQIINRLGDEGLFSRMYDEHFAEFVPKRLSEIAASEGVPVEKLDEVIVIEQGRLGEGMAEPQFQRTLDFLRERANEMDDDRKLAFANQLADLGFKFWDLPADLGSPENTSKKDLTDSASSLKTSGVKQQQQLPGLLKRLNKAAAAAGKKTALAKFLTARMGAKVPLASVSRWLSGDREPGGEVALQLEKWVDLQERQQK